MAPTARAAQVTRVQVIQVDLADLAPEIRAEEAGRVAQETRVEVVARTGVVAGDSYQQEKPREVLGTGSEVKPTIARFYHIPRTYASLVPPTLLFSQWVFPQWPSRLIPATG